MPNDYVGRYGAALRQLTALEKLPGLPSAVSPAAPQPGAFGAPAQQQAGAFQTPPPAQPAMDQAQSPLGIQQLYKDMPDEFKDQLTDQIKKSGRSVEDIYAQKVASGEIAPPVKRPKTSKEKLGYIAEVALRTLSNLSRPDTLGVSDWADAQLATDQRRGALEQVDEERFRQATEKQRLERREDTQLTRKEGREDAAETRRTAGTITEAETRRRFESSENKKQREAALELERVRSTNEKANKPGQVITDENGNVFRLDDTNAKPVTTKKKVEKRGKRGAKWQEEVEVQLRGLPKTDASGVDRDTILREIGNRIKAMKEDRKLLSTLRQGGATGAQIDQEIARRAQEQVMSEYGSLTGRAPTGAPGSSGNAFDQFD